MNRFLVRLREQQLENLAGKVWGEAMRAQEERIGGERLGKSDGRQKQAHQRGGGW